MAKIDLLKKGQKFYTQYQDGVCACRVISGNIKYDIYGIYEVTILCELPIKDEKGNNLILRFGGGNRGLILKETCCDIRPFYKTPDDCANTKNWISAKDFQDNTDTLLEELYSVGLINDFSMSPIKRGPVWGKYYYWDGFKVQETTKVSYRKDLLSGEYEIQSRFSDLYFTKESCLRNNSYKFIDFDDEPKEPTEEEKRIAELEKIIANAKKELDKVKKV